MSFNCLELSAPILKAIADQGYDAPTPIQEKAIPVVLAGKDVLATAQTGTGKTASFVLPLLERLKDGEPARPKRIRALILAPTRELVVQVEDNIKRYGKHLSLTSLPMYGGTDLEPQKRALIDGVDIVVATPGRLLDMVYQRALRFDDVEVMVLDEADRMLDMGFIADINKIIERMPHERQNLLFSATLSEDVRQLARTSIFHAVEISVAPEHTSAPEIKQWLVTVDKDTKSTLLAHLITEQQWDQALIFVRTKHGAAKLATQLQKRGIPADAIHGDKSQVQRTRILSDFKSAHLKFLVATDIASRGIDINALSRVVNYDLPPDADDYIHRIGRTGRAGTTGEAVSLVSRDDFKNLCAIETRLNHLITRDDIEAFRPRKPVPESILNYQPKNKTVSKPKKQGRPRSQGQKSTPEKRRNTSDRREKVQSPWGNWIEKNK